LAWVIIRYTASNVEDNAPELVECAPNFVSVFPRVAEEGNCCGQKSTLRCRLSWETEGAHQDIKNCFLPLNILGGVSVIRIDFHDGQIVRSSSVRSWESVTCKTVIYSVGSHAKVQHLECAVVKQLHLHHLFIVTILSRNVLISIENAP
jgi:hypothetical protein